MDFAMPIGYRRELANVRNAQLKLAQELARLEDMELDVSREMTQALQALDAQYHAAQISFNEWASYSQAYQARLDRYEAGTDPINDLLDSQRFRAQAENAYFQAICEYNKLIALIHRRKGTVLAYNSICLGEGAWPEKAYHDASENARRRGASREVNYGFTRPEVISAGPIWPTGIDTGGATHDGGYEVDGGEGWIDAPYYEPTQSLQPSGNRIEEIPAGPTPADSIEALPEPRTPPAGSDMHDTSSPSESGRVGSNPAPIDWTRFGLSRPDAGATETQAVIRQVSYEEIEK
jgi:hypothetical protein